MADAHPSPGHLGQQALESYLWGAANLLRGLIDAGDYKQYVFPLLFFKRLSDVWDEDHRSAFEETGDRGYAEATANDRFVIPPGAHWSDVRCAARDVGRTLRNAFRAIETANPERLVGVFGNAPWTDKAQMPDATLKNLIEHFSKHTLSLAAVPEDELGNAYEYLVKQFADDSGHTSRTSTSWVAALPAAVQKCLAWFPGVDRTVTGYEGLIAAQECLPDNAARDGFAAAYSYLARLWEAISPDASLEPYETDYRWLSQVYESVKPSTGTGKLIWHTLGSKTVDLIHRHVHVDAVRDDLETLVLDADVLDAVLGTPDPDRKSKEIEIKVGHRLRKHHHEPRFRALGERLEELRQKHEQGLLVSIEFLKSLLELAWDVVEAERTVEPATSEERGRAALTELFEEARNDRTPIIVERVVNDIDEIVRHVRFEGWQTTHAGEREVKKALRKTLFKVPPAPGAVRPGLRLHPTVLLTPAPASPCHPLLAQSPNLRIRDTPVPAPGGGDGWATPPTASADSPGTARHRGPIKVARFRLRSRVFRRLKTAHPETPACRTSPETPLTPESAGGRARGAHHALPHTGWRRRAPDHPVPPPSRILQPGRKPATRARPAVSRPRTDRSVAGDARSATETPAGCRHSSSLR